MATGEPGELGGELVAFARAHRELHPKAGRTDAGNRTFEAPNVLEVDDDALANLARHWRCQRQTVRRHVHHLAGIFVAVGKHVAAGEIDAHAAETPALLGLRRGSELFLWYLHDCPAVVP